MKVSGRGTSSRSRPAAPARVRLLSRESIAHRHLQGDPAAERLADEMDFRKAEPPQRVEIIVRQVVNIIEPLGILRGAEARMLGHDHLEALGQQFHELHDRGRPSRPMEVEQRRALAAPQHAHLVAVYRQCHPRQRSQAPPPPFAPSMLNISGLGQVFLGARTRRPRARYRPASRSSTSAAALASAAASRFPLTWASTIAPSPRRWRRRARTSGSAAPAAAASSRK